MEAAAAVFVSSGVEAPVREIAARAGVGNGHDLSALPDARGPDHRRLPAPGRGLRRRGTGPAGEQRTPYVALARWIDLFVDFLVTKHGLAAALRSDNASSRALHTYFLDRLVPVLRGAARRRGGGGEIRPGLDAYELMRGVGNLCIGADNDSRYDAHRMVDLLIAGLRLPAGDPASLG